MERATVKANAAWDGMRYLVGSFEEPDSMPFELSKETCLNCHPTFRGSAAPGFALEAYHCAEGHDGPEAPACVACHSVHERGGSGIIYFLSRDRVDPQCRACHPGE